MAWSGNRPDDPTTPAPGDEEHEPHEPPRGALLITIGYLALVTALWMQVYLQLLSNGGIPRP
ncbi:MAG: hypothetical protein OHK0015_40040 [Chloroflexi bacterium OHK40]